jgi:chromosome partitioning protein
MRKITLATQKGGAGKTTFAIHLATLAAEQGPAALLDFDPQASATRWFEARSNDALPLFGARVSFQQLDQALREAEGRGAATVVMDTAPHNNRDAYALVGAADLVVVVPTRPGFIDVHALVNTLEVLRRHDTPAVFVLNQAPPKRNGFAAPVAAETRAVLEETGLPVFPGQITTRAAFSDALNSGAAVHEYEPSGKATAEIRALWAWLNTQ